jgi:hypothetical protein
MATAKYALERGGAKTLVVSWEGGSAWRNTEIRLDGELLGSFPDKKALIAGQEFPLPDGSVLQVRWHHRMLSLLRNGAPVPGSATDPVQKLNTACQILYFLAGLNIVLGLIAWFFNVEYLRSLTYGPISIAVGLVLLVLGLLAQRRSLVALVAAIGVGCLHMAFILLSGFVAGAAITDATIPLRWAGLMLEYMAVPIGLLAGGVVVLIALSRGVSAIGQLKKGTPPEVA